MMATYKLFCQFFSIISLILCISHAAGRGEEKRWSRQISNSGFLNDWIPVQPMVQPRQTGGRVLNFGPQYTQPQNGIDGPVYMNHQQSPAIPSPSTNLGEPFQRIFLQQMHPPNLPILPPNQQQQQLHVSNLQSSAPFRLHHDMQLNQGPQHFLLQHNPHQQQQQPDVPHQNFRFPHFNAPTKPEFIRNGESVPQHEQLIQHEPSQQIKNHIAGIDQHSPQSFEMQQAPPQEEVQLLYVPLDTLYHQQQDKLQNTRYNVLPAPVNPLQINNFYTHHQKFPATTVAPATAPFKITTPAAKLRTTTTKPVHRFSFSTVTESQKPKSHQPPLAMFMRNTMSFSNEPTVNDVLSNLIFSRQIDVIDSVNSRTPDIFIGPYGLNTPEGYTKFELPYLSSLEQNRSERQISMLPFFVAPLSYRVPKGFAKIPLPMPHVGSVIVNSPNSVDLRYFSDKDFFYGDSKFHVPSTTMTTTTSTATATTTTTKPPPLQYFSYSTTAPVPERQRQTTSRFRLGSDVSKSTYQSDPETIPTTPSSLTSFNVYKPTASYKSQSEQNVPRIPIDNDEPDDQTYHFGNKYHSVNHYATVSPAPKQQTISEYKPKDDTPAKYFSTNSQPIKNATSSFAYKNEEPNTNVFGNYFTQTSTGSYFHTIEPVVTTKQPEITRYEVTNYDDRYNSFSPTQIPSTSTSTSTSASQSPPIREESAYRNDDVEKMKSYFREQEAFKVHQPIAISTPAAYYESSTAGTLATEKGFNEFSTIPSKLTYIAKEPKQQNQNQNVVTTPRTTVTYYTASASLDDADNTNINVNNNHYNNNNNNQRVKGPAGHNVHQFRFVDSVQREENRFHSTPKPERERPSQQTDSLYVNEIHNTSPRFEPTRASYRERQTVSPYDENEASYNIPSELSPIGANLPGLVNSLMEKDGTTPLFVPTTAPTVTVTTRRSTVSRRRPQTTQRSTTTDENSAPEITTRRPLRSRRPINYAIRNTTARTNTIRNPNRVRFNPSADERNNNNTRQRIRTRTGTRPTKDGKQVEENIDYQRDVLKQNYPVALNRFEKNITKSSDFDLGNKVFYSRETTITPPYEQTKSDKDIEPLNSVKDSNYYGGRDDTGANSINRITTKSNQDVDSPIFVSTTTLTSIQNEENQEEITEVLRTRKPSFIRRVPSSNTKPTTQKLSSSADYDASRTKERNPSRQKNWQETNTSPTRTVKLRTRGKRPNSIPQTTTVGPTDGNTDQPFYKERKQYSDSRSSPEKKRNQFRFSLNAEESQWSTKYNTNSFQPINSNEKPKVANDLPEVEIVTASPMSDSDKEMYSFNVQANFFDFNKNKENESASTVQPALNSVESEAADAELSKLNGNANAVTEGSTMSSVYTEPKSISESYDEANIKSEKKGKRRGIWKRVRVRPVDSFEAAESQNLGKQLLNTLYDENKNNANVMKEYSDRSKHKYTDFESDILPSYDEIYDQVQTVLPIQMDETSTSPNDSDLTTLDIEAIEATTEPILKDERELEATSTSFYRNDDDDDDDDGETATTTFMPFSATENRSNDTKRYSDDFESMKVEKAQVTEIMKETRDKNEKATQSSSIMDEVKQKLTELFSFEDDDVVVSTTERVFKINRNFGKRPKSALPLYTSIDRDPLINDIASDDKDSEIGIKSSPASMKLEPVPIYKTILKPITEPSSFHKELMDSVIYATSTSTEISHETEICYRGRCVKTQKKP